MTDKELLEYAAKAAGHSLGPDWDAGIDTVGLLVNGTGHGDGDYWDPLQDDGDALRLAVKLKITIQFPWDDEEKFVNEVHCWNRNYEPYTQEFLKKPFDATRRAIVRAAAEIGKAMESK